MLKTLRSLLMTMLIVIPPASTLAMGSSGYLPATLVQVERSGSEGRPGALMRKTIRATRSDGSRVEAVVDADERSLSRTITLPSERKMVIVHEALRAVTTYYLSQARSESLRVYSGNEECTHVSPFWKKVGEETILGYRSIHFASKSGAEDEAPTFEHWVVPALNCSSLRDTASWVDGGKKGMSVKQVESVNIGEPDPKLFEIPSDYREMSPSAVELTRASALGRPLPPSLAESVQKRDRACQESRKHKPQ